MSPTLASSVQWSSRYWSSLHILQTDPQTCSHTRTCTHTHVHTLTNTHTHTNKHHTHINMRTHTHTQSHMHSLPSPGYLHVWEWCPRHWHPQSSGQAGIEDLRASWCARHRWVGCCRRWSWCPVPPAGHRCTGLASQSAPWTSETAASITVLFVWMSETTVSVMVPFLWMSENTPQVTVWLVHLLLKHLKHQNHCLTFLVCSATVWNSVSPSSFFICTVTIWKNSINRSPNV